jgi:Leucine-rich repeat (LRR) protein
MANDPELSSSSSLAVSFRGEHQLSPQDLYDRLQSFSTSAPPPPPTTADNDNNGGSSGADDDDDGLDALLTATDIRMLDVSRLGRVPSLDFLRLCPQLHTLNLSRTECGAQVTGLPPTLQVLNLSHQSLRSLHHVEMQPLSNLRVLDLSNNDLLRTVGLAACPHLSILKLARNRLSVVEGLETLRRLEVLDMRHNQLASVLDFRALSLNTRLAALELYGNPVCPARLSAAAVARAPTSADRKGQRESNAQEVQRFRHICFRLLPVLKLLDRQAGVGGGAARQSTSIGGGSSGGGSGSCKRKKKSRSRSGSGSSSSSSSTATSSVNASYSGNQPTAATAAATTATAAAAAAATAVTAVSPPQPPSRSSSRSSPSSRRHKSSSSPSSSSRPLVGASRGNSLVGSLLNAEGRGDGGGCYQYCCTSGEVDRFAAGVYGDERDGGELRALVVR